ncbi:hypothetical protein A9P82_06015 [Arachidicoccus ginsenosidimutans]|nr:hypothetical protein A9P82_05985 [Arachidicoccus sp. BS20]ANI88887.1 hypothetical protein A9P82_06015 [Arachidicoccus sp. BS20]
MRNVSQQPQSPLANAQAMKEDHAEKKVKRRYARRLRRAFSARSPAGDFAQCKPTTVKPLSKRASHERRPCGEKK